MTGFLCAVGIAGSVAFSIGWQSDAEDPVATPLTVGGAALLAVAGIGGLIRAIT